MTRIVQIQRTGDASVLELVEVAFLVSGFGVVLIRQRAIGLNFVDLYHRTGMYPVPLPAVLGVEAAGEIIALGAGVEGLAVGQRVAYAGALGAYATERTLPAWRAVALPPALQDRDAATLLARGITAHMLQHEVYRVDARSTLHVLSAAGGLGNLLVRHAKQLGARVIATVGLVVLVVVVCVVGVVSVFFFLL